MLRDELLKPTAPRSHGVGPINGVTLGFAVRLDHVRMGWDEAAFGEPRSG
jgi:hypothetical protein